MGGSRSAGSASRGISLEEVAEGGSTALLFAARSGDIESARLLVAAGADVHERAADGNTALNIASHGGHGSLAAFLLDVGADPNTAPLGYTALHAAVLRGTLRDRGVANDDPGAGLPSCARYSSTGRIRTRARSRERRSGAGATTSPSRIDGSAPPRSGSPPGSSRST